MSVNRGKKSIAIDLKNEKGKRIVYDLIKKADIVIENNAPGVMEKLGLGYECIKKDNPKIIYASISGFGQSGPLKDKKAYDQIIQGYSGAMSITGELNRSPVRVGFSIGDLSAGLFSVISILGALHERKITGKGCYIDIGMLDCMLCMLENAYARYYSTGEVPYALGTRHPVATPVQAFETKKGFIILAVGNDSQWEKFCKAIDNQNLMHDERFTSNSGRTDHQIELEKILEPIFKTKSRDEWIRILEKEDVPCGPINNIQEMAESLFINSRSLISFIEHKIAGSQKFISFPVKINDQKDYETSPPQLGEHTELILRGLGYSDSKIKKLIAEDVIGVTLT